MIQRACSDISFAALFQSAASARLGASVPATSVSVPGVVHMRSPTLRSSRNGWLWRCATWTKPSATSASTRSVTSRRIFWPTMSMLEKLEMSASVAPQEEGSELRRMLDHRVSRRLSREEATLEPRRLADRSGAAVEDRFDVRPLDRTLRADEHGSLTLEERPRSRTRSRARYRAESYRTRRASSRCEVEDAASTTAKAAAAAVGALGLISALTMSGG